MKHTRPAPTLGRRSRRFAEDAQGAALVEFAFMFPILMVVLFMTITLSHMMMIDRKVTLTAQGTADLISQFQQVDQDFMVELKTAAELMMQPFAPDFDISVAHVPFHNTNGTPDMSLDGAWWARINPEAVKIGDTEAEVVAAGGHKEEGGVISAPTGVTVGPLGTPGDALIIVRMNYRYQSLWLSDFSLLGLNFPATMTFSKETYARPRLIRQIASVPLREEFVVP